MATELIRLVVQSVNHVANQLPCGIVGRREKLHPGRHLVQFQNRLQDSLPFLLEVGERRAMKNWNRLSIGQREVRARDLGVSLR